MEGGRAVGDGSANPNVIRSAKRLAGVSHPSLKVWVKADKEGTLASCATISADPRVCASTFVGKPALSIEKTGPETAMIGGAVTYNIVVANKGSAIARNVVVTDTVPAGLTSADGKSTIVYQVGDLGPNQSKTISVPLRAAARGKHCNVATADSSNAGKVSDEACTVVLQPGLKIFKSGDKEQFLSRNARYTITVTNTGDAVLNDVVVTDLAPDPTSIVVAEGASVSGKTATWRLASLRPGEGRTFTVSLTSRQAGEWCNGASVVAAGGNVVDLAVGVIIGVAFGKVITSLVKAKETGAAVIAYGSFLNTVIDFTIVAFCIFMVIKGMNSLKKKPAPAAPAAPPEPTKEEKLLAEIRDVLKARG